VQLLTRRPDNWSREVDLELHTIDSELIQAFEGTLDRVSNDPADVIPQSDVVVLAVPLTDETRGMIDRETMARMKDGAWLVNIARGAVVDTEALVEALDAGKIGAAFLDVTDPEPLPEGHTLWNRENVLITPHVAARAELSLERRQALMLENMRRFAGGEPLLNVVDKEAGY
jgi:phosphoglycerate dehydrogenase-like enzyme